LDVEIEISIEITSRQIETPKPSVIHLTRLSLLSFDKQIFNVCTTISFHFLLLFLILRDLGDSVAGRRTVNRLQSLSDLFSTFFVLGDVRASQSGVVSAIHVSLQGQADGDDSDEAFLAREEDEGLTLVVGPVHVDRFRID
jgi:hypothetical protein